MAESDERPEKVGDVSFRDFGVAVGRGPVDDADAGAVLVREQRVLVTLLRPQQLLDGILERSSRASTDGLHSKRPSELFWRNGAVDQTLTSEGGRM